MQSPGQDTEELRLLALTTYIPVYEEVDAAHKHDQATTEKQNDFVAFMAEFSRKFGFPLLLKFAFSHEGHVVRNLADLKAQQDGTMMVLVSAKPDLHLLTSAGASQGHRRIRSSFLSKQLHANKAQKQIDRGEYFYRPY